VYAAIPVLAGRIPPDFFSVFISCAIGMTVVIASALLAIYLGPLFGIIRENSTFGEVVRAGDSKRKNWLRLRLHIQRPSEIAFFYENRSRAFHRNEGLVRWGVGFGGLLALLCGTHFGFYYMLRLSGQWPPYEFHVLNLTIHGCALALASFAFSHAKNTTYLRLPFIRGWTCEVSRLDTTAFLVFALISTVVSIAVPYWFERAVALPGGKSVFPGSPSQFVRVVFEGTAVISLGGLVLYAFQRLACLGAWIKSTAFVGMLALYFVIFTLFPAVFSAMILDIRELREVQLLADLAPYLGMTSPAMVLSYLFGELISRFPRNPSTVPFYAFHGLLLAFALFQIRRRGRQVRKMYLAEPAPESP
jgi:hypothetical protein